MKNFFVLFTLVTSFAFAQKTIERLKWVDKDHLTQGTHSMEWRRNPFLAGKPRFVLNGVVVSESAFINGKWFRIGDEVEDYRLTQITNRSARLERGKFQFELFLLE